MLALPAQYRMAVHLYYYEELSVAEIAAVLGKSEGAVKSRLFRARALLRRYLKDDGDVAALQAETRTPVPTAGRPAPPRSQGSPVPAGGRGGICKEPVAGIRRRAI